MDGVRMSQPVEGKGYCTARDQIRRPHRKPLQELPCQCSLTQWYKCQRPQCLKKPPGKITNDDGTNILCGG